jgi:hypothetical protein
MFFFCMLFFILICLLILIRCKFIFLCQNLLHGYSTWLSSNNTREANLYLECFQRWDALIDQEERVLSGTNEVTIEGEKLTIRALDGFSSSAAAKVFEEEIREVV